MVPISEFVIYFPNAANQTKHGDIEKIKVTRCQSYILKAKEKKKIPTKNQKKIFSWIRTLSSRFKGQCVDH
jgi:hypothetical protein